MELTRRDAVAALAAIGGAGGAAYGYSRLRDDDSPEPSSPSDEHVLDTMQAVAEVVYPSELSGREAFVEEFASARLATDDHGAGIREAVAVLDDHTDTWYDEQFVSLPAVVRENALENLGADVADEDPTGSTAERVRYYLVNELLLALYSSPTGGKLVGIENPQGHPGGIESYQQGPDALDR
ncbi:gluconate 2-dehydrogenase subunit 3 family protein [Halovenus sp. WSH3]|uniref:Gluconate 2-dehydrogenase subunit 3 family protein n=1 Tax=Halovenus carboxidivorans TaxID=2692199 RepID=A0A6B0SZP8_9EURY|nr:gluconate 2-dehydrogenase subunit 3 family protein [Halovenus carboxidivorans]MXR50487.1 gluconate 2-dehydrogenase subunit 3 family protein [Halovenus carboxidivorans]